MPNVISGNNVDKHGVEFCCLEGTVTGSNLAMWKSEDLEASGEKLN